MGNMLLNLLGQTNPAMAAISQIARMMQTFSDPMSAVQQMAQSDPRMQQLSQVISQNGGIQNAVYALARQKGIDPNVALQQAQQMMQQIK